MRALIIAFWLAIWGIFAAGAANAAEFRVYIDTDNNSLTGCAISTPGGTFAGAEELLITTVDTVIYPPVVTGVTRQSCVAEPSTLGAPVVVSAASWPVGVGAGTGGYDVIETYFPGQPTEGMWRLGFSFQDAGIGSDSVLTGPGGRALAFLFAQPMIPALGAGGLALLALLVGAAAFLGYRRTRSGPMLLASLLMVLVLAPVWAAIGMVMDGQTGDWAGVKPVVTDPTGDSPPGADVSAIFVNPDGGRVYFRADVKTASAPSAAGDTYAVLAGASLNVPAAPNGLLANDTRGGPPAPLTYFGGGNASASINNAAGSTITFGPGGSGSLTVNGDGSFAFTPATGFTGPFVFSYRLTNLVGSSDGQVTISVNQAPAITSGATASFTVGMPGSVTVTTTGYPSGASMTLSQGGSLPAGVTFTDNHNGTATLAGTPNAGTVGPYPITITAANGIGSNAQQSFNLNVVKANSSSSVSAPSASAVVGQPVTFTATVATTAGAGVAPATGTVNFLDNGNPLASNVALSGGSAGFTTSALTLGAHSITVEYGGNVNLNSSAGAAFALTVGKGATASTVTSSQNPSAFGQSVTFEVTVAAVAPAVGTPGGNVVFKDGGAALSGTLALAGGKASYTTSALAGGAHNITADYAGDANFNGGTSNTLAQTVNAAVTTTSLGTSPSGSTKFGESVTLTATVGVTAPGAGVPDGTVTFKDGAATLGTGTLAGNPATATLSLSSLGVASHNLSASYAGTGNFAASNSAAVGHAVSKASTTTTLASNADPLNPPLVGANVTFTATVAPVAPGAGTPGGSIDFYDNGNLLANVALSGGVAQYSTTALAMGTHPVTASYGGDAGYLGSGSNTVSQVINRLPSANADSYSTVHDTQLPVAAGSGLLVNDVGNPAPTVSQVNGCATPCATVATVNGGTITLAGADGSFTYDPPANFAGSDSFSYTAHSTLGDSVGTATITVSNVLPVVDLSDSADPAIDYTNPAGFTEGGGAVLIVDADPVTGLTITDTDSAKLASATIKIANLLDGASESLSVTCPVVAPGCSGAILAADVAPYDTATGILQITSVAPKSDYQALLRTLRYNNGSQNPDTTTRDITVTVNDRIANNDPPAHSYVTMTAVNNPPVLAAIEGAAADYQINAAPTAITASLTVTDPDSPNLAGATVAITGNCVPADDVLGFTNQAGISGVYTAATCTMALSGSASPAAYQAALRSVTYSNNNAATSGAARTVSFRADDGAASSNLSNVVTRNINVYLNSPPALTAGGTLNYLEGQAATAIDTTITVTDSDSANLTGATATITTNCASGEDELSVATQNGISGVYTAATCLLTLSGTSSLANYQTALRSVRYTNTSNSPSTLQRTVTWQANDGQAANNLSNTPTSTINLTLVNSAPSFTKGADKTVLEDAGAQSFAGWATSISAGPADESGQTVDFIVSNDNNALFSAQPAVAANGTLTFTPAANMNGTATVTVQIHDDGGTANGGVDTSAAQTFTITVTAVNDVPSFTKGADKTVTEDTGAQSFAGWATSISAGPANESGQAIDFIVSNDNNSLFSAQPAVAANGTLTFTPAANMNGTATVTVQIHDDGGTANGGVDTSAAQTFTITVTSVNDAPSFTKGADKTVTEDAGAQSFAGWATSISAGPANESGQTIDFIVSNDNNSLFSAQPAVAANGTLTFTPAANMNGTATVTVQIHDDGGTANGGVDTSAAQTFTITVTSINDAPSFTKGADKTVLEDAGVQSFAGWATAISAGPANESGQTVDFIVSNDNNSLFSAQPAVAANGTLTFTPAANMNGIATVTVQIHDDGGTANGGVDTSAAQTFTITVSAVNDAPVATSYTGGAALAAVAGIPITFGAGKLGGTDVDIGSTVTLNTTPDSVCSGCLVTINANGSFTFTPPPAATGTTVSFTYHVADDGKDNGASLVSANSAAATVSFNVTGEEIYFVKQPAVGDANCTLGNECTLSTAVTNIGSRTGTSIFIGDGNTHTASVSLKTGGWLIGQGITGTTFDSLFSVSAPAQGTLATRPSLGQTAPTISLSTAASSNVALTSAGTGYAVRGVTLTTGSATTTALSGSNFGTLNVSDISISGSGPALDLSTGALSGNFTSIGSTGGANGIKLATITGTSNLGSGALANHSGDAFYVSGGSAALTYSGTIASGSARSVNVGSYAGTLNLSGSITESDTGISLTNNTGGTINFTGQITASTTSNAAFTATGGGTVSATNAANTLTTTTGTALNVANTTIGAGGLTFQSITAGTVGAGPANAIILNSTGSGALTVSGTGTTDGSGGTIQKTTDSAIKLTSASNVSLSNMNLTNNAQNQTTTAINCGNNLVSGDTTGCVANLWMSSATNVTLNNLTISGSAQQGIAGTNVTGFTLADSLIHSNGGEDYENGILFKNLKGTVAITNTTVRDNYSRQAHIYNDTGTMNITVSGSRFGRDAAPTVSSQQGLLLQLAGISSSTVDIGSSTINNNGNGNGLQIALSDSATLGSSGTHSSVHNMTSMTNNAAHVYVSTAGSSTSYFDTMNNAVMTVAGLQSIDYFAAGGTLAGIIQGNTIGTSGVAASGCLDALSGCDGMTIDQTGTGALRLQIASNTIQQINTNGIAIGSDVANNVNISITNNTIRQPSNATVPSPQGTAIYLNVGITASSTPGSNACFNVSGNTIQDSGTKTWDPNGSNAGIYSRTRNNTVTRLPGAWGSGTVAAQTNLLSTNTFNLTGGATQVLATVASGGTIVSGAVCSTP